MRRLILTSGIVTLMLLVLAGCNDDFMDRVPKTAIGETSFFKSENDLSIYSYGLYSFDSDWMYVGDQGSDIQATTSAVEIKNIMSSPSPSSINIPSEWSWDRLKDVNFLINAAQRSETTVPDEARKHFEGVGRLYRALFYYDKVKRYSDVPWYEETLSPDDSASLYKAPDKRTFVVDKIFEDLDFAVRSMRTPDREPSGAIHKYVALTYAARIALHEGTYRRYHPELGLESTATRFLEMARSYSHEIIASGKYSIYTTGDPDRDYLTLFTSSDLSQNSEVIYNNEYDSKLKKTGFWAFSFGRYECCPTKAMVQTYLMRNGSYYTARDGYRTNSFVEEFEDRDPRMSQTLAYPGWVNNNPLTYSPGRGVYIQQFAKNFSGYHLIKGYVNDPSYDAVNDLDIPSLRYAEVLLIYAEASAELGRLTQEDVAISLDPIRHRAGMPDFDLTPKPDTFISNMYPGVSPLLCEIRRERQVELAFEGFRLDDLYRWHRGKLLEHAPEGIYFPSLGKYDLTGDGVPDICLIPSDQAVPAEKDKEINPITHQPLRYYKTGSIDDADATVYLTHGHSGNILTIKSPGVFKEPTYYYRPVPHSEVLLNPKLLPQPFGWQ